MTEKQLNDLVKRRGCIKTRLTCFSKYLANINKSDISDTQLIELEQRLINTKSLIQEFNEVQSGIDMLTDEENMEQQIDQRFIFENNFYTAISKAENYLSDRVEKHSNLQPGFSTNENEFNMNFHRHLQSVKLPTIKLPQFDGNYETWFAFRDTYISLIHTNRDISKMQKYHYLRAALEGSAARVIDDIEFSEDCYDEAWNTIYERFNNIRSLTNNHLKALVYMEPIDRASSSKLRDLVDKISKHLKALSKLNEPVESWDTIIIFLVADKLDNITSREWDEYNIDKTNPKNKPTLTDFKTFLKNRADLLESWENRNRKNIKSKVDHFDFKNKQQNSSKGFLISNAECTICKGNHPFFKCQDFLNLSVENRIEKAKSLGLCLNCLNTGHYSKSCKFSSCKHCDSKHNSLLHLTRSNNEGTNKQNTKFNKKTEHHSSTENNSGSSDTDIKDSSSKCNTVINASDLTLNLSNQSVVHTCSVKNQTLLSTALINIFDSHGNLHIARALLDSGAQSSFVTSELCKKLHLKIEPANMAVTGLANTLSNIQGKVKTKIKSLVGEFNSDITCFVISQITSYLPNAKFNVSDLEIPPQYRLADPSFNIPGQVDMLIGADLYWRIMLPEMKQFRVNHPVLQKTVFGWIVSGPYNFTSVKNSSRCNFVKTADIQEQLQTFWEIEEGFPEKSMSPDEVECENHFLANTTRNADGRFVVKLPLKSSVSNLGESRDMAIKQFMQLERKLQNDTQLRNLYTQFLKEYEALQHMSNITNKDDDKSTVSYYIPHHGVFKETSTSTKLRVVFNASMPTTSGLSLNDLQLTGPTIQEDLLSILLRFRKHQFVISADVKKMYRQVLVNESDRPLQKIFWRENQDEQLQTYQLNTVTYGTTAGSFLAIRCLNQLGIENLESNPKISNIITSDFYVDDLLSGADSIQEATEICTKVSEILKQGCFELAKWRSNNNIIINNLPRDINANSVHFGEQETVLGLTWSSISDNLLYKIKLEKTHGRITKRTILSTIAKIFDPLGLLSPCILYAKIILQKLWLVKISWDDPLSTSIQDEWSQFKSELPVLNSLEIPRKVICSDAVTIHFHCFSDASQSAYGGCIYVVSRDEKGNTFTQLLCSKSKVSPIKTITTPRLELCGALLVSKLAQKVFKSLKLESYNATFWTDSSIVLGWLNTQPNQLKTFVSHRVSEIQTITNSFTWRHVPTKQNPADLLTRGVMPKQIKDMSLWWEGPLFLQKDESEWPESKFDINSFDLPELRKNVAAFAVFENSFPFDRFSNLIKLKHTVAYMFRFKQNCLSRSKQKTEPLSVNEINNAFNCLLKIVQRESFPLDYANLSNGQTVHRKSKILSLSPFMDSLGLIRVGGRLKNSKFDYNKKHPILLPAKHHLTKLIFRHEHLRLFHGGAQILLATIREKYWPISGRNIAKLTVRECIRCYRYNTSNDMPIMGNLPSARVVPGFPFEVTGVDYAGPYLVKTRKGRGAKTYKTWICLFICMKTRAVHLELVTDLSTNTFMLSLRRFISRRGKPGHIYSDHGTNFVGASSELKKFLNDKNVMNQITDKLSAEAICWHFIPAKAPHMGGMWENGVKICKHHLNRVMGNVVFTFEELYTLLVQIESILNSRPICPLSSDPNDLNPLTPSHFLLGRAATSLPEPDLCDVNPNRLTRFQLIQQIQQNFWRRWQMEYINQFQQRYKWKSHNRDLKLNDMVFIKEENLPPRQWKIGRVCELYPGSDGVCRVADVKTTSGVVRSAISKLRILPVQEC